MSSFANSVSTVAEDTEPGSYSPKISIVMAAYNEEHVIGKALESILSQTFTDWELFIIHYGSTDGATDVVQRYAEPRIPHINPSPGTP